MPFRERTEEELADVVSLDDYLVKNPEASFIFRVKGDRMSVAGIMSGDLVIAERGRTPKSGDIVILYIEGEHVMKYFLPRGNLVYLESADGSEAPFILKEDLKVEAVVTSIVRTYV